MAEDGKLKMTFIIEDANYHYEVMPFGLKRAGATYQRLMDKVFRHLGCKCIEVYVDDMVKTDYPIQKIMQKPNLARCMSSWSVELSKFSI